MLERADSARLKPVLWGKLERRGKLEMALRKAEFHVVRGEGGGKTTVVDDPCDESDFKPPKPRPLKSG